MARYTTRPLGTRLCAMAVAASLVACDRPTQQPAQKPSVGQKIDGAVARIERKADAVTADVRAAGKDAQQAAGEAVDAMVDKTRDAAITATVNAELAKDPQLGVLRVEVDTVAGRVTLRGTVPDGRSRARATTLAQRVDGVESVDNQLHVGAKG